MCVRELNFEISENKAANLELLKKSIINLKNCNLKRNAKNIVLDWCNTSEPD